MFPDHATYSSLYSVLLPSSPASQSCFPYSHTPYYSSLYRSSYSLFYSICLSSSYFSSSAHKPPTRSFLFVYFSLVIYFFFYFLCFICFSFDSMMRNVQFFFFFQFLSIFSSSLNTFFFFFFAFIKSEICWGKIKFVPPI